VLGPDGLSQFEELAQQGGWARPILYAFDLIEHDGEDLRSLRFLDRKAALARLLRNTKAASCLTNTSPRMALSSSRTPAGLALRASCRRRFDGTDRSGPRVSGDG
jgi:ATP-dependent DNA ligase